MSEPHTVPVIERMMELIGQLEAEPRGLTISELVKSTGNSRSTIYRILNTLHRHGMVRRDETGCYRLGPRLLRLAARLPGDPRWADVTAVAMPHLRSLSRRLGETSKLSVLDGRDALCLAGARGGRDFALNLSLGERYPLHAGAASKVLFAALRPEVRAQIVSAGLAAWTARTVTRPSELDAEAAQVSRQGWAEDRGEYELSVRAFAAPIRWEAGEVVAAASVAFLAEADPTREALLREGIIELARAVTRELGAEARVQAV